MTTKIVQATEKTIKTMVDAFLKWKLPETFSPDGGIYFNKNITKFPAMVQWPVGTNLFTATEAEVMVRHLLSATAPIAEPVPERMRSDAFNITEGWIGQQITTQDLLDAYYSMKALDHADSDKWIAVGDRLPPNNWEHVLAYGDDADGTHYWSATGQAFYGEAWLKRYNVTHWMPLPAKPK